MVGSDSDCILIEDPIVNKSVTCTNVPVALLDKNVAKKHFSQFGQIHNLILRPKRYSCTVEYETNEAAANAIADGYYYDNVMFEIVYTPKQMPKLRSDPAYIDPDVQMELNAMSSSAAAAANAGATSAGSSSVLRTIVPVRQYEAEPVYRKLDPRLAKRPITKIARQKQTADLTSIIPPPKPIDTGAKNELETILKKAAYTSEERFRILDARDKLIRLTTARMTDIKSVVSIKGVCPDMCPEKERLMREATHHAASYELEDNSKNVMKHSLAVKQYARSSADQEFPLAHELRPEPVLQMTMNYLLHKIVDLCDMPDTSLGDWFHFVWDRTRSIRKDISQQELCSQVAVSLVEQCARLHIHCAARLVAEEPQIFDQKINSENLTKCLQSLKYLYHDLHLRNEQCPNEAEFRAYVVLLNLNDCQFFWEVKQLPHHILHSPEVRFAIQVYLAVESNNYVRFFKLVRETTYMNACIMLRYFNQVRVSALNVLLKAYVPRGPVSMTISCWNYILAFEDFEQTAQFFEYHGLQCDRQADRVILDRSAFLYPDMPFILERAINVVEHKRICSVGEVIHGKELGTFEEFEKYEPHDSFDEHGFLLAGAWTAEDQNYLRPPTPKRKLPHHPFREEESVFKMPLAPQLKTQQHPKPSIFTKLSPKSINEQPPSAPMTAPVKSIFGGNLVMSETNSIPPKATENIFASNSDFKPAGSNIFGGSVAVTTPGATSNMFAKSVFSIVTPIVTAAATTTSSNTTTETPASLFKLPAIPSNNVFGTSSFSSNRSEGMNIFGKEPSQPQSGLFSSFQPTPLPPSTSSPKPSSIFASYRDYKIPATVSSGSSLASAGNATTATTTTMPKANMFGRSFFTESASDSVFSPISSTISGIVPIKVDETREAAQRKAEEIRQAQAEAVRAAAQEEERIRQQKELADEKRRQAEREENLERERAILKKQAHINKLSAHIAEDMLTDYMDADVRQIASAELGMYKELHRQATEHLDSILGEIIEEEMDTFIAETIRMLNLNITNKYFCIWRAAVRRIVERREKISNTPIWLPEKPLPERVPELQHPRQMQTLNLKRRYRQGRPDEIVVPQQRDESIDIFAILAEQHRPAKRCSNTFTRTSIYWKCVLSLPGPDEYPHQSRMEKWLDNVFVFRVPRMGEVFFCEQFGARSQNMGICLRKLVGTELRNEVGIVADVDTFTGANAVLFFMSDTNNLQKTRLRLEAILRRVPKPSIGIVYYNSSSHVRIDEEHIRTELNFDDLMNFNDSEDDFPLFAGNSTQQSFRDLTVQCLKHLTSHNTVDTSILGMQSSVAFLTQCLGDQLWNRVNGSVSFNPGLYKAMTNVSTVIALYNNAIDRIIEFVSTDWTEYPEFPVELKRFVPKNLIDIPVELEHFPNDWKNSRRQRELREFLKTLKLKSISLLDISTMDDLQRHLLRYSHQHLDHRPKEADCAAYRMIQSIMLHLQNVVNASSTEELEFAEQLQRFSWVDPIKHLTMQMLSVKYEQTRQMPLEVIYKKDDLRQYTTVPWWLNGAESPLAKIRLSTESNRSSLDVASAAAVTAVSPGENTRTVTVLDATEMSELQSKTASLLKKANEMIRVHGRVAEIERELSHDLNVSLNRQEVKARTNKRALLEALHQDDMAFMRGGTQQHAVQVKKQRFSGDHNGQSELDAILARGTAALEKVKRNIEQRTSLLAQSPPLWPAQGMGAQGDDSFVEIDSDDEDFLSLSEQCVPVIVMEDD